MIETGRAGESHLQSFARGLWRRKLLIAFVFGWVVLATVLVTSRQESLYEATAEVLLTHRDPVAAVTNGATSGVVEDAERASLTQVRLARVTDVAARTLDQVNLTDRTAQDLLDASSVSGGATNILTFTVKDPNPELAKRLASEYAEQYTIYRREREAEAIKPALAEVVAALQPLNTVDERASPLYAALIARQQELLTILSFQNTSSSLVQEAQEAEQVQPLMARNLVIAGVIGLVLGIVAALLRNSLDTRIRSTDEIATRLGLPLLARIPEPPKRLRANEALVMMEEPRSPAAEAFRLLRTSFEFMNLDRKAHVVLLSSATEDEGKTTTAANLAVAVALAGRRVMLVDLDVRRPSVSRYFGIEGRNVGLTDVALGYSEMDDAIVSIPLANVGLADERLSSQGQLEVLPCGPVPPNAGEFVSSRALADILAQARARADLVLIDSSPLLRAGDALSLTARVDALIVVTRLGVVNRSTLTELDRVLKASPVTKLGFVATGGEPADKTRSAYFMSRRYGVEREQKASRA